ncbi:MAG TPA: hypothetical protein VGS79_26600 [Puia sp.]|nr:hypothetical protein [Puia sp.]
MNSANLQLSPEELRLVSDPGWILTKNSIVAKAVGMMGELAGEYREVWGAAGGIRREPRGVAAGIDPGDPKVSRGENYRGLPWVMLDYPRVFGRADVLAIRTMFWWGHGFNITLHLKGAYQGLFLPVIRERWVALSAAGFHVGVHPDEWRHEHTQEVFRPFTDADGAELGGGAFLKLSAAVGLDRWAEAPELLAGLFGTLVGVLRADDAA